MKRFLVPLILLLAGCDSTSGSRLAPLLPGYQQPPPPMADDSAARVQSGAPLLLVTRVTDRTTSAFVEVAGTGPMQTWRSIDNVTLGFQDGLLVTTRGLSGDLMSADVTESRALVLGLASGQSVRVLRYLDGQDAIAASAYVCDIAPRGPRDISFDGRTFATVLMQEQCQSPRDSFQNLYWVSGNRIVQSRQWVSGDTGALALRDVIR